MKDKKQITIISLLGALAVGVLASAVVLGNAYNNSQSQENETEYAAVMENYEPETIAAETEPETETKETSEAETELEAVADETETEAEPETEAETEDTAEADETTPETDENKTPTEKLMSLFETGAPLRWARAAEESDEFVKVYPELSFAYYDIDSGEEIKYNSDEIRYSASLIKAPYIYSVLCEIEEFEKNKKERDEDGNIIYHDGEEKYDLGEKWVYDSAAMLEEGSGEIMEKEDGFELTWKELIDYALLYSDNIAFAQLRQRFGYKYFYEKMAEIGVTGVNRDFMSLSADDCVKFLITLNEYFESGSEYAEHMKDCMTRSKHLEMICAHYDEGEAAHKYGWDIGAFHDMALILDEHPYIIVIMTDYEDGGKEPTDFIGDVTELVKQIHAEKYPSVE